MFAAEKIHKSEDKLKWKSKYENIKSTLWFTECKYSEKRFVHIKLLQLTDNLGTGTST